MAESALDEQIAEILRGLLRLRRLLDPGSFESLLGAVMVEIDMGMEAALEQACRPRPIATVVPFPARPGQRAWDKEHPG